MTDLVRDICLGSPPVPSRFAPVPAAVDAWFARAVSREPTMRFESARAMADALSSALATPERASVPPSGSATLHASEVVPWTKPLPAQEAAQLAEKARERAGLTPPQIAPAKPTPFPRRGGSDRAGYEVSPEPAARLLVLRLWGLWDMTIALAFRADVLRAYDALEGAPWVALSLSQQNPPQKPEVQAVHTEMMGTGVRRGLRRVAVIVSSALSQMQIRRLFEESGGNPNVQFFQDEAEGRAWLASQMGKLDAGH
jgi:hypothetical protein